MCSIVSSYKITQQDAISIFDHTLQFNRCGPPLSHQNDTKQVELLQSLVTYNQRTLRLSSLCLVVVYLQQVFTYYSSFHCPNDLYQNSSNL